MQERKKKRKHCITVKAERCRSGQNTNAVRSAFPAEAQRSCGTRPTDGLISTARLGHIKSRAEAKALLGNAHNRARSLDNQRDREPPSTATLPARSRLAAETGSKGPKRYEEINEAVLGAQLTFKADCDVGRKDVDPQVL